MSEPAAQQRALTLPSSPNNGLDSTGAGGGAGA